MGEVTTERQQMPEWEKRNRGHVDKGYEPVSEVDLSKETEREVIVVSLH